MYFLQICSSATSSALLKSNLLIWATVWVKWSQREESYVCTAIHSGAASSALQTRQPPAQQERLRATHPEWLHWRLVEDGFILELYFVNIPANIPVLFQITFVFQEEENSPHETPWIGTCLLGNSNKVRQSEYLLPKRIQTVLPHQNDRCRNHAWGSKQPLDSQVKNISQ